MREVKLLQSVTMSLYPVLQRHMKVRSSCYNSRCHNVTVSRIAKTHESDASAARHCNEVDYVVVTMSLVELENYLCGQRQYLVFSSRARRLLCCSVR